MKLSTFPYGNYENYELDPNAPAFMKSIGYSEEIASAYGGNKINMAFEPLEEPDQYRLIIEQPAISRHQEIVFKLGEDLRKMPNGKWVKTGVAWEVDTNILKTTYLNSDNLSWTIDYYFTPETVTMVRDSQSVHSVLQFTKV